MINKQFIFLAGHHRSGTSLLHEIIRSHPLISGFKDTGIFEDEGQHLQSVFEPAQTYGGPGKYIFNKDAYMDENHPLANNDCAVKLLQEWSRHLDSEAPFYIEKSPPNLIRTRFFQKLFPNSKFVIILRHPLAVSYATQKWSKTSIKSLVEHTILGYETLLKDLPFLKNVHIIRYEDFVTNPQEKINEAFQFLELSPVDISHEIRENVNDRYFQMWEKNRKSIIRRSLFKINNQLESRANIFGYSLLNHRELLPSKIFGTHKN